MSLYLKGMYYRLRHSHSVAFLVADPSAGPPVQEEGDTLRLTSYDPLTNGAEDTHTGLFFKAALRNARGKGRPEPVHVYKQDADGHWQMRGRYRLVGAKKQQHGDQRALVFRLEREVVV